jgi:hypothetical protein
VKTQFFSTEDPCAEKTVKTQFFFRRKNFLHFVARNSAKHRPRSLGCRTSTDLLIEVIGRKGVHGQIRRHPATELVEAAEITSLPHDTTAIGGRKEGRKEGKEEKGDLDVERDQEVRLVALGHADGFHLQIFARRPKHA